MSTTVTYKGDTLATVSNNTKTLKTAGKYMEGDVVLTDVSGGTAAISVVDTTDSHGGTIREITALDISDTTAVASDVAQGKYFYTSAGVKTAGTASGGGGAVTQDQDGYIVLSPIGGGSPSGGGLEYEEGTWTPSEDVMQSWIYFTNAHTDLPLYIFLSDSTGTLASANSNVYISIELLSKYSSERVYYNTTAGLYGRVSRVRRSASDTGITTDTISITEPTSSMISSEQKYPRYWVTEEGFCNSNNTSYFWRAGRTYKWIAVWAPTT